MSSRHWWENSVLTDPKALSLYSWHVEITNILYHREGIEKYPRSKTKQMQHTFRHLPQRNLVLLSCIWGPFTGYCLSCPNRLKKKMTTTMMIFFTIFSAICESMASVLLRKQVCRLPSNTFAFLHLDVYKRDEFIKCKI